MTILDNGATRVHEHNGYSASQVDWLSLFNHFAPYLSDAVNAAPNGHVRCPMADWTDRHPTGDQTPSFRIDDLSIGSAICTCDTWPNGFALLAELKGWTVEQARSEVAALLYSSPNDLSQASQKPDNEQWANDLWENALSDDGTISTYLRSRGLSGHLPPAIRLNRTERYPMAVCAVTKSDGRVSGVSRIYLDQAGGGKAPIKTPKTLLGKCSGGAVRLAEPANGIVAVTEGVETGIAVSEAIKNLPVWACLTTAGLRKVEIPDHVRQVIIFADNDASNSGQDAAEALASRLHRDGKEVFVLTPDAVGEDWLDVFLRDRASLLVAYQSATRWQAGSSPEPPAERYPLLNAAELDEATFELDYLIPGILVRNQPCVVGAPVKCLKTSIVGVDLSISLASGRPFLNHFTVPEQTTVCVLSAESGAATLQETARRVAASKGISLQSIKDRWHLSATVPNLKSEEDLQQLRKLIRDKSVKVLILDPLYLALPANSAEAASMFDMGRLLRALTELAIEEECTPVLIHHFRQSQRNIGKQPELEDLSHAGVSQLARQWILISRRTKYRDDGRHELWMRCGGSAGHSSLWGVTISEGLQSDPGGRRWETVVSTADAVSQQKADEKCKETLLGNVGKILGALKNYPQGETQKILAKDTQLNHIYFRQAITAIDRAGVLKRPKVQKSNGQSYDGFSLDSQHCNTATEQLAEWIVSLPLHSGTVGALLSPPPPSSCAVPANPAP